MGTLHTETIPHPQQNSRYLGISPLQLLVTVTCPLAINNTQGTEAAKIAGNMQGLLQTTGRSTLLLVRNAPIIGRQKRVSRRDYYIAHYKHIRLRAFLK
jgi:hypothetical protein